MTIGVKIPDTALRGALRDLYEDYAAALDEMRLEDWTTFFTEDAVYRVIGRETFDQGLTHATIYCEGGAMIRDRAACVRRTAVYEPRNLRHFISGVRVVGRTGDEIEARANFMISEAMYDRETRLYLAGEYRDRLAATPEGLKFTERTAVYDNYRIPITLILPV
jgi:anthranilate 1,2-dioxygenase small subunit